MSKLYVPIIIGAFLCVTGIAEENVSADAGKSAEQWRESLLKHRGQPDPELKKLELGCTMRVAFSNGGDGRHSVMKNYPEYKEYKKHYLKWLESEGRELTRKWRSGSLEAENKKYIPILTAEYLYAAAEGEVKAQFKKQKGGQTQKLNSLSAEDRDCMNYFLQLKKNAPALMTKGYMGEPLTQADIETLHAFAIWMEMSVRSPHHLPHHFGLTRHKNTPDMKGFPVGVDAPDFMLPKLETVLKRPEYSNEFSKDYAVFLRKESLEYFFDLFSRYEPSAGEFNLQPKAYAIRKGERPDDYIRLSSFEGKKPVVVVTVRNTDGWWYRFACQEIKALHHAYRDRVEFLYVQTTYSDPTAGAVEYFGPLAGKHVCLVQPWKAETLAREAKLHWMDEPWYYIPTLIDDVGATARNSYMAYGGDAHFSIIDIDGKIAYDSTTAMFKKLNKGYNAGTLWANLMETELIKILDHGGKFIPNTDALDQKGADFLKLERELAAFPRMPATLRKATAVSVNDNILTVKATLGGKEKLIKIKTTPFARIEEGVRLGGRSTYQRAALKDIQPGSPLEILLWQDSVSGEIETQRQVNRGTFRETVYAISGLENNSIENPRRITVGNVYAKEYVWLTGRVSAFDAQTRKLTVKAATLRPEDLIGYTFWKEHEGAVSLQKRSSLYLPLVKKWIEESGSTYHFIIDDGVDIFVNGRLAGQEEIKKADKVSLYYRPDRDVHTVIYPDIMRLSR